jgi:hypothetical protein
MSAIHKDVQEQGAGGGSKANILDSEKTIKI